MTSNAQTEARAIDLTRPIIGIENRTAQEVFDIMCDRFRAIARAEASAAVKVKALKWKIGARLGAYFAHDLGLTYAIDTDHACAVLAKGDGSSILKSIYNTAEQAKAAAQADYERRIRSALTAEPAAPQEAEEVADEFVPNWFVTCVSGDGDPFVKVAFKTLPEAQDFHKRLMTGSLPAALIAALAQKEVKP